MTKSRRGRPRQQGERFPCGKLKGEADPEPRAVAAFKRARVLAEAQVIDPRWGSAVAQLVFFRRLSDREAAAADRWAEWVGRHDRIKGFPRRSAASPRYDVGFGPVADNVVALRQADEVFLQKFSEARKAAIAAGGIMGIMALDDVAVLNLSVGSLARLERMRAALRALLGHWGM